jgi:hypothetical protein
MENAIRQIIDEIQPNYVFDSHFVISQIIRDHSDIYIHFAGPNETTAQMHGRVAQIIQRLPNVRQLQQQSWSTNIHGTPSECALWQRIDTIRSDERGYHFA